MKKLILLLSFCLIGLFSIGQNNRFPTIDSLKAYILKYYRNSTVETFTNLRGQNIAYGTAELLDSLTANIGGGVDSIWRNFGNGSDTLKYSKNGTTYTIGVLRNGAYVPYTGATADVDLGNNSLNAKSINVTGTAGNGHIHLKHQSSDPSSTGGSTTIYANTNGNLGYKNDGLNRVTFNTLNNTADRVYSFQNKSYTLADSADVAGKQGALTLTTTGSSGAATLIGNTLNIPQYSGGGGGSADSTYQTIEIGTPQETIGLILNESFNGGSIPSGWTKGASITTSYTGGKLTVTGSTTGWGIPATNNNNVAWLAAMQYDTERMMWEKQTFTLNVVPQTKSAGGLIAVTHGSNSPNVFTAKETIAWDLSNSYTSGRVSLGSDAITSFSNASDSSSRMEWSVGDSLVLYYEKDGWNVTAGIINKTTGKISKQKFTGAWNGIGGRFNYIFLNGTYHVTNTKVYGNDRKGGVWIVGHSRVSGSGATAESKRYANLLFNSNYKYFGVVGLPAISAEAFSSALITEEIITRAQPSKVLIDLGSNDIADAGRTPAQIKIYIDSIGQRFQRGGADVNIMGQFTVGTGSYIVLNDSLRSLATQRGWGFVGIDTGLVNSSGIVKNEYNYDGVHYNDSGQVIVAQKIAAKLGFKLLSEMAADTSFKVKFHGLQDGTFANVQKIVAIDTKGNTVTIPNIFANKNQYIANNFGYRIPSTPQGNSSIYTSDYLKTDGVILSGNSKGLRINFGGGSYNNVGTAASIINITDAGTGGSGVDTAFDRISGNRVVKILASGSRSNGNQVITGNDILSIQSNAASTITASDIIAIGLGSFSATSGGGSTGIGKYALKNISTGANNIHLTVNAGIGNGTFTSSLSNSVFIGDPVKTNGNATVAGDIVFTTPWGSSTQFWMGGKSDASDVYINFPVNNGTNSNGWTSYFRTSAGAGTGTGGRHIFQTWNSGSSGSTLHSTASTELTIENKKVTIDNRFQTSTGADVASANDLTLGNDGNVFTITGTTQINAITTTNWQAGSEIILIFNASVTVKNATSGGANTAQMLLSGSVDFSATANDVLRLVFNGTSWFEVSRSVN